MKYRVEGHDGVYWVYPADVPTPSGSRMVGACGFIYHGYWGWRTAPVRRNVEVRGWGWITPTRRQALAALYAWLDGAR